MRDPGKTAFLVLTGVAVYFPALRGDWVWDDAAEVVKNAAIKGPASALAEIWLAPAQTDYFPLKTTVQWVEWHLWGDSRLGWHATSLGLHILSAYLLWQVLARLGAAKAWWGGLLFLLHPLAVESVAWVSELKNTLSLPLLLLAWKAWLDEGGAETGPSPPVPWFSRSRLKSLAWFTAAMLAKSSVVMFPVCLLLYVWWRRGRIERRDLLASLPFFAVSGGLGIVTVVFQAHRAIGAGPFEIGSAGFRVAAAAGHILFYLGKFFWPARLLPLYVREPSSAIGLLQLWPWLLLGLLVTWLWQARESSGRTVLFGFGWFVVNLLPVLGVIPMAYLEYAPVADHFAYVAMLGLVSLVVAAAETASAWLAERSSHLAWLGRAGGIGALIALGALSFRQAGYYRDALALWSFVVRENPGAWAAQHNLAEALAATPGRQAEAREHYETALHLKPDFAPGHYSLAVLLARQPGHATEAMAELEIALRLKPDFAEAHNNLANLLSSQPGRQAEAIAHYETALRLQPDSAEAHCNLALLLSKTPGREAEALAHDHAALRLQPDMAEAHDNLGVLLSRIPGRQAEAEASFATALRLKPDYAEACYNLALLLAGQPGRETEALGQYLAAVRLKPDYVEAHNNLAILLARLPGRQAEAEQHFETALRLNPDYSEAHHNLGLLLASEPGRESAALAHYATALRLRPDFAEAHNNLATLLTRLPGRQAEAESHFETALRLRPGYAEAENNWANLLAGQPGRQTQAVAHYEAALRLQPNAFLIHLNLALVLERMPGAREDAIRHLRAALAINPGYTPAREELARLQAAGR